MGCNSLCIKDMAGIMSPQECYDLVTALKQNIKIPVYVHTHATTGLGYMTYLKAAEAGADGIDCATSCMSGGTSQPATESMVYALQQMGFDCGVDTHELNRINEFFIPFTISSATALTRTFCPPRRMRLSIRFRAACCPTWWHS